MAGKVKWCQFYAIREEPASYVMDKPNVRLSLSIVSDDRIPPTHTLIATVMWWHSANATPITAGLTVTARQNNLLTRKG